MKTPSPLAASAAPARAAGLTLDHVYIVAALVMLALRPLMTVVRPNDFWWHMAMARETLAHGAIPAADMFSFTRAGELFFNQAWLAQLLMYGLFSAGGLPLVLIVQALVIALAYGLLLRLCVIRSGRLRLSVALLLLAAMPLSFDNWTVRPQSYVFPIFAVFLTVLTEHRIGRASRLWLLPPLMVVWVNMHGSFALGLALIGISFGGEWLRSLRASIAARPLPGWQRPYLIWGAATALATLVNPAGPGALRYVSNLIGSNQVTQLVTEWAPPDIRDLSGAIFFLFVMVCGTVLIYAKRKPELTDMLLFGAFLWLALGATRNIVWFGFVATPLLAMQAATLLPPPRERRFQGSPAVNGALVGVLALLLLLGLPWVKPALALPPEIGGLLHEDTPVAATERLRELPERPERLFHAMSYGSYLIWAAPEQKVFIDPRIELYPFEQWLDYIALSAGRDAGELAAKYRIDGFLLSKTEQRRLIERLRGDAAWAMAYEDDQTVLLVRSGR
jgi:hypothetical protein